MAEGRSTEKCFEMAKEIDNLSALARNLQQAKSELEMCTNAYRERSVELERRIVEYRRHWHDAVKRFSDTYHLPIVASHKV